MGVTVVFAGDKYDRRNYGEVPVWTDEMVERRRSVLTEGYWEGKLGSSVTVASAGFSSQLCLVFYAVLLSSAASTDFCSILH